MRLTDRIRASLGQTEVAHFSCLNEGLYRSGNILHGNVRINTVLVEEVDPIGTQALERLVGDLADALRAAVRPFGRNAVPEAKFRCDDHLVAHRLKRLAHDLFIEAWAIGFGRIEEGDASVIGGADEFDRFRPIRWGTEGEAHAHAAQAERGDFELSKFARLHFGSLILQYSLQHPLRVSTVSWFF